jgi:DNA mismatch repair protein MutS
MPDPRDTPAMRQYARFKAKFPACILLFRIGDFYEMFDDDALRVSKAIGLTLTQRTEGIPMCGVPYHQLEVYLRRLIDKGFQVAVCEQVQDAREAKGVIERDVTRVITPGTLVDDSLLAEEASSTLAAAAAIGDGARLALAVADLSTGSFVVLDCARKELGDELARRAVHELLYAGDMSSPAPPDIYGAAQGLGIAATPRPGWQFRPAEAREALLKQFGVAGVAGFGLAEDDPALAPAGALVRYLLETQTGDDGSAPANGRRRASLAHLRGPRREAPGQFCVVDATSLRALEVERTIRGSVGGAVGRGAGLDGSLLGLFLGGVCACRTAMGKRLVGEWLRRPLADIERIGARQKCVAVLVEDRKTATALGAGLGQVQDLARIAARVALGRASPRDLVGLARSIGHASAVADALAGAPAFEEARAAIAGAAAGAGPVAAAITGRCCEPAPGHLRDGGVIKDGVDAELDEARLLRRDAGAWLVEYQARLVEKHRLPGLKVGYNKVFGYFIELTQAQSRGAPAEFARKQTLKNAERYTTPELVEFERKVATAEARAMDRERAIFEDLCARAGSVIPAVSALAEAIAEIDVLGCFAERAVKGRWVRPRVVAEPVLSITGGRHPVLDEILGGDFVPNDVALGVVEPESGADGPSALALITGPNMAGKSTYIRQVALLVLLAHTGSFVPAEEASVGLTDRIFTRVGADDALHAGQSTFMVEMTETASILNNATGRSLVVLDEIGRGTSTLDGLSLAWAVAESLARDGGPRTLFATHYHELTDLAERMPGRVRNLHVAVREWPPGDPAAQIVFLHRILPGKTDRSYGIHVARLAGIPADVLKRAREVLESVSVEHGGAGIGVAGGADPKTPASRPGRTGPAPAGGRRLRAGDQLALFTEYVRHPAVDAIREMDLDGLTPMRAFDEVRRLKRMVDGDEIET